MYVSLYSPNLLNYIDAQLNLVSFNILPHDSNDTTLNTLSEKILNTNVIRLMSLSGRWVKVT